MGIGVTEQETTVVDSPRPSLASATRPRSAAPVLADPDDSIDNTTDASGGCAPIVRHAVSRRPRNRRQVGDLLQPVNGALVPRVM